MLSTGPQKNQSGPLHPRRRRTAAIARLNQLALGNTNVGLPPSARFGGAAPVALDGDLAGSLPHCVGVVPRLHVQQRFIFSPNACLIRSAISADSAALPLMRSDRVARRTHRAPLPPGSPSNQAPR